MDNLLNNGLFLMCAGLLIALPVVIVLLFVKKMYKKFSFIMLTLALCSAIGLGVYGGIISADNEDSDNSNQTEEEIVYSSEKDYYAAFSGYMLEGDYASAQRIAKDCADIHGWTETCSLMTAHISFAKKDYRAALAIYTKLGGDDLCAEGVAAQKIIKYMKYGDSSNNSLITGEEIIEAKALLSGGAAIVLSDTLNAVNGAEEYRNAASVSGAIESLWEKATVSQGDISGELSEIMSLYNDVKNKKKLNRISPWRVSRMKLRLLGGDFSKLVSEMDEYSTLEEYTVVLDLMLNKKITGGSLKKSLGLKEVEGLNEVVNQLKHIKSGTDITAEEKDLIENQIDRLNQSKTNDLYYHIENKFLVEARDIDNIRTCSKLYLSLAEYSGASDKMSTRNEYFSQALSSAADSDDEKYAEAMNGLADAITGAEDYGSVKDVDKWAAQAVANSSYVSGSENIVRDPEQSEIFKEAVQDYTIKAGAAITINNIDTSRFNEVVATIQVSDEFMSETELKNLLKLYDCSIDIESFDVEKVDYEKANIILCCDNSGSMSGSVDSLINAVSKFLETSTDEENIGFYTFSSSIDQRFPLGSSKEDIMSGVNSMYANGGTNIYGTVYEILSSVEADYNANNIIIVMTDGQDGSYGVSAETIAETAFQKGYIIYTMGMGSGIDVDYLQVLPGLTGGQFIYSPTDAQLESLYTFIHGQVKNKYKVTYKTVDTLTVTDRTLKIELKDQNVSDLRYYNLSEKDEDTAILPFDSSVSVHGLEIRYAVKQNKTIDLNIKGTGFTPNDSMHIKFKGLRSYEIRAKYVDSQTFVITLPANIALGVYDMELWLNQRYGVFKEELTVTDGSVKEVVFGGYKFTAAQVIKEKGSVKLLGNVVMNDWLNFNGGITLKGDLEGNSIVLSEYGGSRISYSKVEDARGFVKYLKDKNLPFSIPFLGEITLFNSAQIGDEYPTSIHVLPALKLLDFMVYDTPEIRLYPDKISLKLESGSSDLPFQDFFLADVGRESPFEDLDFECEGTITNSSIDIKCEAAINYPQDNDAFLVKFLDCSASMSKKLAALSFDTSDGSFGIEFNIKLPTLADQYIGLGVQWANMKWDGIQVFCDVEINKMAGPVPITFSDFSLGVKDMAKTMTNQSNETISSVYIEGGLSVAACKVSALVPKLKSYVGDVSVLSIPQATFRCSLAHFSIEAEATLEMLNCIEIMKAKISIGDYDYSNPLLGISDEAVSGLNVELTTGLSWDAHNLVVELTGEGSFSVNRRFLGATYEGAANLEMNWWIFEKTYHKEVIATVGFYTNEKDQTQFTVRASYMKGNKRKGAIFYITENGKMDYDLSYNYNF